MYRELSQFGAVSDTELSTTQQIALDDAVARSTYASLAELVRRDALCMSDWAGASDATVIVKEVGGNPDLIVGWFLQAFPGARVLLVNGDPRMIARSVIRDRARRGHPCGVGEVFRKSAEAGWVSGRVDKWAGHPRCHQVRYVELVNYTRDVIREAAGFLGLGVSDSLLQPTVLGRTNNRKDGFGANIRSLRSCLSLVG